MPHPRLQAWPHGRSAEPHDEAQLAALCDAAPHAPDTLDADDCAALASLSQRADHLRCLLTYPCAEEPTFTLDGVLPPLHALIAATPYVEAQDVTGHAPLTARGWATATLELAALLGGDQGLSVLGMVMSEVEGASEEFDPVYAQALGLLRSLTRRAVAILEAEAGTTPATIAQCAPLLAAARLDVALEAGWPSAQARWEGCALLPEALRGAQQAWRDVDARIRALAALERALTAAPPTSPGDAPPGQLVWLPAKGLSVVLERDAQIAVVAAWARPARPTTWYPRDKLLPVRAPSALKVLGSLDGSARRALLRYAYDVVDPLRDRSQTPADYAASVRQTLHDPSGLESYVGRAFVDEHATPRAKEPANAWVAVSNAWGALQAHLQDHFYRVDPTLGAAALERAHALAQRAHAEADAGPEPDFTRKQALELLAIIAWLRGESPEEAARELAARCDAATSFGVLLALASFGRWDALAPHLRDDARRDKLKQTADGFDLKEAAWAEHELAVLDTLGGIIAAAPDSLDDATQRAIRARLKVEQGWSWSRPMIHWLRLLWWREGGALGPYDVLARVFDELPLYGNDGTRHVTARTRPPGR